MVTCIHHANNLKLEPHISHAKRHPTRKCSDQWLFDPRAIRRAHIPGVQITEHPRRLFPETRNHKPHHGIAHKLSQCWKQTLRKLHHGLHHPQLPNRPPEPLLSPALNLLPILHQPKHHPSPAPSHTLRNPPHPRPRQPHRRWLPKRHTGKWDIYRPNTARLARRRCRIPRSQSSP